MTKGDANPMQRAHAAPRCTARSKRTGAPCGNPAVRGRRVCRMHGAGGGHATGEDHPAWRHGERSAEAVARRCLVNDALRGARAALSEVGPS